MSEAVYIFIKPFNDRVRAYYTEYQTTYKGDSGLDLVCPERIVIPPGGSAVIDFGIACEIVSRSSWSEERETETVSRYLSDKLRETETGSSFWLVPRSSIGKTPLRLANSIGLVDAGYRGTLRALVDHIKPDQPEYVIESGTRLFQIALPTLQPFSRIVVTDDLSETDRGSGGFGSTGK